MIGAALGRRVTTPALLLGSVGLMALCPLFVGDFFLSAILTQAIWLGLTALSLIFLAGYVGMVSLAQVGLFGFAGFTYANLVVADGGVATAWSPWPAAIVAVLVATSVGMLLGAVASRSTGIYFLMITLAFGVIIQYFFEKVTQISGFGGINNVSRPGIVSAPRTDPDNIFYISLVVAFGVFLLVKYVTRTPFGIALQGVRDDPTRMRALGYNVELHRVIAFGFAAFVASIGGILFVWWSTRIDPGNVNIGSILDVLIVAVIGGLFRLEGAWVGAIAFVALDNYTRNIAFVGPQFNTLIGLVFLGIVLLSPGGLLGIWETLKGLAVRLRRPSSAAEQPGA